MLEQAAEPIWTVALEEELDAFLFFIFVDEWVFLHEIRVSMGELALVSVPAGAFGHPVLAHLRFVQGEVFLLVLLEVSVLVLGIKRGILSLHLPHLLLLQVLTLLKVLVPLGTVWTCGGHLVVRNGHILLGLGLGRCLVGRNESVTI